MIAFGASSLTAELKRGSCDRWSLWGKVDAKPDAVADDLGGKAVAGIRRFTHLAILPQLPLLG